MNLLFAQNNSNMAATQETPPIAETNETTDAAPAEAAAVEGSEAVPAASKKSEEAKDADSSWFGCCTGTRADGEDGVLSQCITISLERTP